MIQDESEPRWRVGNREGGPGAPGEPDPVVRHTVDTGETIDDAVIGSLQELGETDADPTCALEMPPMYDSVDVDALAALYTGEGSDSVTVEFRHAGYQFTVTDDEILVEGVDDAGADDGPSGR